MYLTDFRISASALILAVLTILGAAHFAPSSALDGGEVTCDPSAIPAVEVAPAAADVTGDRELFHGTALS